MGFSYSIFNVQLTVKYLLLTTSNNSSFMQDLTLVNTSAPWDSGSLIFLFYFMLHFLKKMHFHLEAFLQKTQIMLQRWSSPEKVQFIYLLLLVHHFFSVLNFIFFHLRLLCWSRPLAKLWQTCTEIPGGIQQEKMSAKTVQSPSSWGYLSSLQGVFRIRSRDM